MKNEGPQPETTSRSVLAKSIIEDQPVKELIKKPKKKKKAQVSKTKPELVGGVTYDDVFHWYNLSELLDWARKHSIKVSGKKREVIQRIIVFLADGADDKEVKKKKKRKRNEQKAEKKKQELADSESVHAVKDPKEVKKRTAKRTKVEEEEEEKAVACKATEESTLPSNNDRMSTATE